MGLSIALKIALSGLKTNQTQLDTTANNIANAGTEGYSRKIVTSVSQVIDDSLLGVEASRVNRALNLTVQRQWRTAVAASEYAATRTETLSALDQAFGGPNNPNSLDAIFNRFTQSLETLASSPENNTARIEAVDTADLLAHRLRSLSDTIQDLRQSTEDSIGQAVSEVNELLTRIAGFDREIVRVNVAGASSAGLEDERDLAVDRLAKLIDIRVEPQKYGAISILTTSGALLYDDEPVQLGFDGRGGIQATMLYTPDPAENELGSIVIEKGPGQGLDLFADESFRQGKIAALKELRDETLVRAQAQLDEFAAKLSEALGTYALSGTETAGPPKSFAIDLTDLAEGNVFSVTYETAGVPTTISFVAHNGVFNGGDDYTANPDDTVVGLDISQADAVIEAAIQAALGANFTVTYAAGALDVVDASAGAIDFTGVDARLTIPGLQSNLSLPLFLDGATSASYTGLVNGESVRLGLSARLIVNPAVTLDPAYLVKYAPTTDASDDKRPRALLDAISKTAFTFDPAVGIGSITAPFSGTVEQYVRTLVSSQGAAADAALQISQGQEILVYNLEERYGESRKVDIDEEMAQLIALQTAYQANARVMTVAQEMLEILVSI